MTRPLPRSRSAVWPAVPATREKGSHHYMDRDSPGTRYGQTCLVERDKDGDLDLITGSNADGRTVFWFEFGGGQVVAARS